MAFQFLALMVALDALVYKPVGAVLDNRDKDLRSKLEAVKDNAGELLKYTVRPEPHNQAAFPAQCSPALGSPRRRPLPLPAPADARRRTRLTRSSAPRARLLRARSARPSLRLTPTRRPRSRRPRRSWTRSSRRPWLR